MANEASGENRNGPFRKFAQAAAEVVGSPSTFFVAVALTLAWAAFGPVFGYSNGWQLVINTGTSIVTLLTVFLIQHTQNREARVMQLKLDELIRSVRAARTELVSMEGKSDSELDELEEEFRRLQAHAARNLDRLQSRQSGHGVNPNPPWR